MSKVIQFSTAVELLVRDTAVTYLTACLEVAEQMEIDEDKIPKYVSESLKQKIEIEALGENTLKRSTLGDVEALTDFI